MAATFTSILTAHLLGCFISHTAWRPGRSLMSVLRSSAIVTSASYLLLGSFHWQILLAVFLAHAVMGTIEAHHRSDALTALLVVQLAHIAILLGLSWRFPAAAQSGWWISGLPPEGSRWYFAALTFISGLILCVPAGGSLIAKLTRRFAVEIRGNDITGLKRGGQYIGWLERFLVMLLLLMDQPNGIGFLIAAKSILRFGEIKDPRQRRVAEYIIIGTFLSFGWALLISALTQKALRQWIP